VNYTLQTIFKIVWSKHFVFQWGADLNISDASSHRIGRQFKSSKSKQWNLKGI
jgi:hypothetical protein